MIWLMGNVCNRGRERNTPAGNCDGGARGLGAADGRGGGTRGTRGATHGRSLMGPSELRPTGLAAVGAFPLPVVFHEGVGLVVVDAVALAVGDFPGEAALDGGVGAGDG